MSTTSSHAEQGHAVRPPQFGLRSMLIGMTILSATFALFVALGAAWSAMLVLFGSLISLHIMGNVLGMRLREGERDDSPASIQRPVSQFPPSAITVVAPARRLQENTPIRRPWLIAGAVCAMLSGSVGGVAIAAADRGHLTPAGLALGIGSSALVGGLLGFMACSLWMVARTALREAL